MTIDTKCQEYHDKFRQLEQEQSELYKRIRVYCNSCIGVDQIDSVTGMPYKSRPKEDVQYLLVELNTLVSLYPEYNNVAHRLYERMRRIVNSNTHQKTDA